MGDGERQAKQKRESVGESYVQKFQIGGRSGRKGS